MLTKSDFLSAVAKQVKGITKAQVEEVFDAAQGVMVAYMNEHKTCDDSCKTETGVRVPCFGTVYLSYNEGRKGVNPRNPKETLTIEPYYRMSMSISKALKEAINDRTSVRDDEDEEVNSRSRKNASKDKAAPISEKRKAFMRIIEEDDDDDEDDE